MIKRYFFLGLAIMLPYVFYAQLLGKVSDSRIREENKDFYEHAIKNEEDGFELKEVPEKWIKEPVVMLCQKILIGINLTAYSSNFHYTNRIVIRKRLIIQDKSALEEYSQFHFQTDEFAAIKVIKSNGEEIKIDLRDAVEVNTEIPRVYRNEFNSKDYYKVAIPNLEVGDIIDYAKTFKEVIYPRFNLNSGISYDHPVVYQKIVIDYEKGAKLIYNSFNDAPEFKLLEEGFESLLRSSNRKPVRLVLEDKNRSAINDERWNFTLREEPKIKLAIRSDFNVLKRAFKDIPATNSLDWQAIFKENCAGEYFGDIAKEATQRISNLQPSFETLDIEERVNVIHRTVRYHLIKYNKEYGRGKPLETGKYMNVMASVLYRLKIPFWYAVAVPRNYGALEEVIFKEELAYGIFIGLNNKYYWLQDQYTVAAEGRTDLTGVAGAIAKAKTGKDPFDKIELVEIPPSQSEDHILQTKMEIGLNTNSTLDIKSNISYGGGHKNHYTKILISDSDYWYKEQLEFSSPKRIKKLEKRRLNRDESKIIEVEADRQKAIRKLIEDDYEINEIQHHEVTKYGTIGKSPNLIFEYQCTSDAYVKKAGNNLILELGRLISSQVELTEEEIESRTKDVNYEFAREFVHEINITLPDGYVAKGLDQFNMNVDNEYAAFISSVAQEGNMLKLNSRKAYKNQTIPVENWAELVEMLEAAYNFTQKKVILSKS